MFSLIYACLSNLSPGSNLFSVHLLFFGLFIFVPLQFFPAFSLPDIFFCGLVVPTFGMVLVQDWSYGALPGLAALYIYIYMYIYISLKSHLRLDAPDRV